MITVTSSNSGGCLLTRTSPFSGQNNTMDLPVSPDRMVLFYEGKIPGLIQEIFPDLDNTQREFVLTGHTQADWDAMFPPEEDEKLCYHCSEHPAEPSGLCANCEDEACAQQDEDRARRM